MIYVLEFCSQRRPLEVMAWDGERSFPTGNCRGLVGIDHPDLVALLHDPLTRVVKQTESEGEAQQLVEAGRCVMARSLFAVLAGLEIAGMDPGRVWSAVWLHVEQCPECRTAYRAWLEEMHDSVRDGTRYSGEGAP